VQAVVIDRDGRQVLLNYYRKKGVNNARAKQPFGASQRIMCNFRSGSAAIIEESHIVLTALHVFLPEVTAYSAGTKPLSCSVEV
jgi:hypothetical protein